MTEFMTSAGPGQAPIILHRNRHGDGTGMRILFVAGIRGDDLSGVHALGMFHQKLLRADEPGFGPLQGTIDIYPVSNPKGVDALGFSPDRRDTESSYGRTSIDALVADSAGADLVVHLTMASSELEEAAQVHISQASRAKTLAVAQATGADAIWLRSRWEPGSLCAKLEEAGVPAVAIQLGASTLAKSTTREVVRGLLGIAQEAGVLGGDIFARHTPPSAQFVTDDEVRGIRAEATGLFIAAERREPDVWEGDLLGRIMCPLTGVQVSEVRAPVHGFVLARRRSSAVRPGAELVRIAAFPDA